MQNTFGLSPGSGNPPFLLDLARLKKEPDNDQGLSDACSSNASLTGLVEKRDIENAALRERMEDLFAKLDEVHKRNSSLAEECVRYESVIADQTARIEQLTEMLNKEQNARFEASAQRNALGETLRQARELLKVKV